MAQQEIQQACAHCNEMMGAEALFSHVCPVRREARQSPGPEDLPSEKRRDFGSILSILVSFNPAAYAFFKRVHDP